MGEPMNETIYALGFFDGVHIGHAALLKACRELAAQRGCRAGVVTFGSHPDTLVLGQTPRLINTPQDREWMLRELFHMDAVITLPFDRQMRDMDWQDFLEMLRKNPTAAYTYATRVIQESEGILSLIDTNNIANNTNMSDWNFSTEILGSFYTNNLYDLTDDFFQMGENAGNTNNVIFIDNNRVEALTNYVYGRTPDGSGQDIRLFWFQGNQETGRNDFMKLKESPVLTTIDPYAYYPEVPIMRLSEIYYIACEAQIGVNNTLALEYLNDLRSTRRLDALTGPYDDATLLEYLVREARKDFIGEGRMFFMYKRLFYDIYTVRGLTVSATDAIYVLPIPDEEYEYTGQQKPAN